MNKAYIVAGLAFGDEGKGTTVEYLVRQHNAKLVVRYNGGPQAGHNVVLSNGIHHTFSQFGSGSFVNGVRTHLSRFMLVNPLNMELEAWHLRSECGISDIWERTTVDGDCIIITPMHKAVNRLEELARGVHKHGTCGQGVGRAREDHLQYGDRVLFAKDLADPKVLREKLQFILDISRKQAEPFASLPPCKTLVEVLYTFDAVSFCMSAYKHWPAKVVDGSYLPDLLSKTECSVFEGAQGMMLDEKWGTAPHNTWTDCTFNNAIELIKDTCAIERVGVLRAYFTRHGAGPFPTENFDLTARLTEEHNCNDGWQGQFRCGHLDVMTVKYALSVSGGVDFIVLTNLDRDEWFTVQTPWCETHGATVFPEVLSAMLEVPIPVVSYGPTFESKKTVLSVHENNSNYRIA